MSRNLKATEIKKLKKGIFICAIIFVLNIISTAQINPPQYLSPDYDIKIPAKFRKEITSLYRKSRKDELAAVKPNAEDKEKYSSFLRQSDTGLTRLVSDVGCSDNVRVVVVSETCQSLTMPGAGSSFSFRTKDYRIPNLADITFANGGFQASGVLLHGILTKIGDVPLEKIDLQDRALKFLINFQPVSDYDEARQIANKLVEGVIDNGFVYRRGLNAFENTTYVLRSIAYNGEFQRTINGVNYNELNFDRRKDVIVAFRIVRRDADGSVTLLWKKLVEKDSPKIKKTN